MAVIKISDGAAIIYKSQKSHFNTINFTFGPRNRVVLLSLNKMAKMFLLYWIDGATSAMLDGGWGRQLFWRKP